MMASNDDLRITEDEYFPQIQTDSSDTSASAVIGLSNDEFLVSVFGDNFASAKPLVCCKAGDPSRGGWQPSFWPCRTDEPDLNWFFCPGIYLPDEVGSARAKRELAQSVYVFCLDDVGLKVDIEVLDLLAPTWLIETSPGNFQAGYVFDKPIEDIDYVDSLKQRAIDKGLCDPGASGGSARWMRLPVGINGKGKHGPQGFNCRLVRWNPELRYTAQSLEEGLSLGSDGSQKDISEITEDVSKGRSVVSALKERGLYTKADGPGRHEIVCPWAEQHSEKDDTKSYYFESSEKYPLGGFKCFHSHGSGLSIRSLLGYLKIPTEQASAKPVVVVQPGQIGRVIEQSEVALARLAGVFHMHNVLCTVRLDPSTGDVQVKPISKDRLLLDLSQAAIWERHKADGEVTVIDPPTKYLGILLEKGEYKHVKQLNGIARQPYFFSDFKFSSTEGYDPESKLYGAFDADEFQIPHKPTVEQARQALNELRQLLIEFGFQSDQDQVAALAGMFTAVVRPSLPTAPMFHVRAPQIASGKSYLCSLLATFAGPGTASVAAFPETQEECQKFMLSVLIEAPAVVIFDNLTGDLVPHTSLCSALTEESIQGRILGVSKSARVSTRTLLLSSGNNVGPVKDMTRRTVTIALDPKTELASAREFKFDPLEIVKKRRSHYVSLVLTVINAWVSDGKPRTKCRKLASFEVWSDMVRQPLMWMGMSDPAAKMFAAQEYDPEKEILLRVMLAWRLCFGSAPTMVREAVAYASNGAAHSQDLLEALQEVAENRKGEIDRRRLGHWISKSEGRVVGEMKFERSQTSGNAERWSLRINHQSGSDVSDVSVREGKINFQPAEFTEPDF